MDPREAKTADAERLRELARSAMTTSYALNPGQLDAIVEERFDEEHLTSAFEDDGEAVVVLEDSLDEDTSDESDEQVIAGFADGRLDGADGEVRWLFVDPEHRGRGIGSQLFDAITDTLRERGADTVRATTFEANTEGGQFFERFGFERTDQREIEIGEQSFVEQIYTDSSDDGGSGGESEEAGEVEEASDGDGHVDDADLPDVERDDGRMTATTDDDRTVFLDREDETSGTDGPMIPVYEDESLTEQFGYYCGNCGSLDVAVDETERIDCPECANTHEPRSEEAYDDSYL